MRDVRGVLELDPFDDTICDIVVLGPGRFALTVDLASRRVGDRGPEFVVDSGSDYPEGVLADMAALGG